MEIGTDYSDAHDQKYGEPVNIPLVVATNDSLNGYGNLVPDFYKEEVELLKWPVKGKRKLMEGTGVQVGLRENVFKVKWCHDTSYALGEKEESLYKPTSRLQKGDNFNKRTHTLVRQTNFHPDSSQVIFPRDNHPFVMVMALPADDIQPNSFVGFYFDGTFGLNINPFVWHQAPIPVKDESYFLNKNGAMHAQVNADMAKEFGTYIKVPLCLNTNEK